MARSPHGHYYPWYRDAVWTQEWGNGIIIDVEGDDIVVQFEWWTGTLDNKHYHRRTETIDKVHFEYNWRNIAEGQGYWRLDSYG